MPEWTSATLFRACGRQARAPAEADAIAVLLVLAENKMRILKITLAAALIALIVVIAVPQDVHRHNYYFAAAAKSIVLTSMLGQLGAITGLGSADLGLKNPGDLFVAMLGAGRLKIALIDRFDLRKVYSVKRYQDARKNLQGLSYIIAEREGLISIRVTDRDPNVPPNWPMRTLMNSMS